jgi:anti-anti-sigma regulatory factor
MFGEDAALKLRDEVKRQRDARIALLDLSELSALGGEAMRMMIALRTWTRVLGIQFKLFGPSPVVRHLLQRLRPADGFEIASVDDVLSLLHWEGRLGNRNEQLFRDGGELMKGRRAVLQ